MGISDSTSGAALAADAEPDIVARSFGRELDDKGYLLTTATDLINWVVNRARTGSMFPMSFALACCGIE